MTWSAKKMRSYCFSFSFTIDQHSNDWCRYFLLKFSINHKAVRRTARAALSLLNIYEANLLPLNILRFWIKIQSGRICLNQIPIHGIFCWLCTLNHWKVANSCPWVDRQLFSLNQPLSWIYKLQCLCVWPPPPYEWNHVE